MKALIDRKIIGFIVSLALFMDALDTTIINTAIPSMAHSLQVHPVDLKIALISYLLTLAIFIPISGWLGDKFGIKRVFIFALGVFTLSSFWCGYATHLYELVMARSMQGLGGSLMLPLGRLIILRTFKRHELVDAMSAVIMVVSVGLMLGPFVGGFITDHLSWSWIFWVNIPVGILAMIMATKFLPDVAPHKVRALDFLGFILFGGGLAALTFSLAELSESGANEKTVFWIMMTSILMLIIYFMRAKHQKNPIIDTNLLKIRTFRVSVLGNLCARFGFGGVPFLLPLLLQVALGYSAQLSGTLLVPIAVGVMVVKALATRILRKLGFKRLLIINTVLVGLSLWTFMLITKATPVFVIALLTFMFGLLIALQYSGMNSLAYADITADEHSAATSIMSTIQQIAQSFGVALSALLLRVFSVHQDSSFELNIAVFHHAFLALGFITLISIFIFIRLKPEDGKQMLLAPVQEAPEA